MVYPIWLVVSTPLKNMKVSWDDDLPNIWKNKSHVPNHQADGNIATIPIVTWDSVGLLPI